MRVLFTGISSDLGGRVAKALLDSGGIHEMWCTRHKRTPGIVDERIRLSDVDLAHDIDGDLLPEDIDLTVHFAALTHARDPISYWNVNRDGTIRLAEAVRKKNCGKFVYISTRCATPGSGAYGESKLAAEQALVDLNWERLLIIRPSEIYGDNGREGIDALTRLARKWHLAPMLFGDSRIEFAPLHIDDFVTECSALISATSEGTEIAELDGPEDLSGAELGMRLARQFKAVPFPIWWPAGKAALKLSSFLGVRFVEDDQLQRLVCEKTSRATEPAKLALFFPPKAN